MLGSVTPEQMHAASVVTGLTLALWLAAGVIPALRRHAPVIRAGLLTMYLAAWAGVGLWLVLR